MQKIKIIPKPSKALKVLKKHAPGVALVGGGIGLCSAVVTSSVAAVKSVRLIDAEEEKLGRKLEFKEKAQLCWKTYLPTLLLTFTSSASLIYSGVRSNHDLKAAGLLYTASEAARQNLEEALINKYGEKKFNDIQDEAAKMYHHDHPAPAYVPKFGLADVHFIDSRCNRHFIADKVFFDAGINRANAGLLQDGELTFNEVYDYISDDFDHDWIGDHLRFVYDPDNGKNDLIKTYLTWDDPDENGLPVAIINYRTKTYARDLR